MQLDIDMSPPLDWEVLEGRTWYWRTDFPYFCPLLPPQAPLTLDLHPVSYSCVWADTKREMATNILSWVMERVLQKVILPMCQTSWWDYEAKLNRELPLEFSLLE